MRLSRARAAARRSITLSLRLLIEKGGGLLAQAARNQTQGVEERYAGGTAHSSRRKEGLFGSTFDRETGGRTASWLRGFRDVLIGSMESRDHTSRSLWTPDVTDLSEEGNPCLPVRLWRCLSVSSFGNSCTKMRLCAASRTQLQRGSASNRGVDRTRSSPSKMIRLRWIMTLVFPASPTACRASHRLKPHAAKLCR